MTPTRYGRPTDLGPYVGNSINNRCQVAGLDKIAKRAFLRTNGVIRNLGILPGGDSASGGSDATAVNDRGQVVGTSSSAHGQRAFLWQRGTMTDLGSHNGDFSSAAAINDRGHVAGASDRRAAVWK